MQKTALVLILFFIGCSVKTTPIYAVIKTPKIKISDQGFLKEGFGYKEIIIYKAGVEPVRITVKNSFICLNDQCMDKKKFVKKYLGGYDDLFESILNKKPLKNFDKITKLKEGFLQKDKNIFYLVTKDKVLFKDKKRKIIILIKFLRERG
jgi:hypothetical protein